jgi:hypothetical protein
LEGGKTKRQKDKKTKRLKYKDTYIRIHKEISCSLTLGINQLAAQPKSKQKNIRRRRRRKKGPQQQQQQLHLSTILYV